MASFEYILVISVSILLLCEACFASSCSWKDNCDHDVSSNHDLEKYVQDVFPGLLRTYDEMTNIDDSLEDAITGDQFSHSTISRMEVDAVRDLGSRTIVNLGEDMVDGSIRTTISDRARRLSLDANISSRSAGNSPSSRSSGEALVYHGCCVSSRSFKTYTTLFNTKGISVRLVQFGARKQWFDVDSCGTTPGCTDCNCSCHLTERVYTALVHNPEYPDNSATPVIMDAVKVKSVCRCINNAPPDVSTSFISHESRDEL